MSKREKRGAAKTRLDKDLEKDLKKSEGITTKEDRVFYVRKFSETSHFFSKLKFSKQFL
jgi:hypothetical protein